MAAVNGLAQTLPPSCGSLTNAYGPFDYRTTRDKLVIVETYHFTPPVEMLMRGNTGSLGADLDYTLRASPNHHRALLAMMRYGDKLGTEMASGANYNFECYFLRAIAFAHDDTTVRMLYAVFLNKHKRKDEAVAQLRFASSQAGDNGFTHFNLGMVYVDMAEYDLALERAHAAFQLGFVRPELKDRLVAAGKWKEPPEAPR